jgi:hypothetical protein
MFLSATMNPTHPEPPRLGGEPKDARPRRKSDQIGGKPGFCTGGFSPKNSSKAPVKISG